MPSGWLSGQRQRQRQRQRQQQQLPPRFNCFAINETKATLTATAMSSALATAHRPLPKSGHVTCAGVRVCVCVRVSYGYICLFACLACALHAPPRCARYLSAQRTCAVFQCSRSPFPSLPPPLRCYSAPALAIDPSAL